MSIRKIDTGSLLNGVYAPELGRGTWDIAGQGCPAAARSLELSFAAVFCASH